MHICVARIACNEIHDPAALHTALAEAGHSKGAIIGAPPVAANDTGDSPMKSTPALLVVLVLAGCASMSASGPRAAAQIKPTRGNAVSGTATFTQMGDQVLVEAEIKGLTPGLHGIHIHEKGDCSAPDATSAGGHFNPAGKPHGGPEGAERHAGDLGNLIADSYGTAILKVTVGGISIVKDAPNSVIGRSLIVHADPDDYKTQPTGNSGKRVACAIIGSK